MKKKLNLLWNLKFNFFSVAERPLTFFAYFLNAKKVGRRRLVIVPATAGGLPLFPHATSCSRPGGGNDRPSGFAQRNAARDFARQTQKAGPVTGQPGFAAGEMRPNGSKGRGFAVGAPARRSRDGNGKIAAPVGPMTGQRGFAAGEMEGE